ncbi:MAG: hypothetical protein COT71_02370 [Candidatus Andersenbacteria bacterium CG10_big_fil_rev_8_21_14_0_10_54_11]|uniref:O-antigen ligase-related domain-containing protein n=1 Tax=Candidatus Andersenbacteria bacterium CG10_big_fil_rev_8_21_14_0_10_54_11 TaxID=1974485 RepID=A0A2M6WZ88_9BACT|nr:MAG: hypothetical protein COT71_02370 [Candidatus Andersenbacteria bacterium CG10_big_fil_rev_8_21_14_0_10_54_11]
MSVFEFSRIKNFWSIPVVLLYLFSVLFFFMPSRPLWNDNSPYLAIILGVYFLVSGLSGSVFIPRNALWLSLVVGAGAISVGAFGVQVLLLPALGSVLLLLLSLPYFYWLGVYFSVRLLAIIFVFIALLHAQWGVLQFALQHSLSLQPLGETLLSATAAGVAKFSFGAGKIVRAYGPHPHANPFGGWMLLGLIALRYAQVRNRIFVLASSWWLLLGCMLSFSRAAWAGAIIWIGLSVFRRYSMRRLLVVTGLMTAACAPLLWARFTDQHDAAAAERYAGSRWALGMLHDTKAWIFGTGWGTYLPALSTYLNRHVLPYEPWQLDYVHSVPLLLLAETGIAGLLLLTVLLGILLYRKSDAVWLSALLPAVTLDHYMVTQPAPLLAVLLLLVLVRLQAPAALAVPALDVRVGQAQAARRRPAE